MKSGSLGWLVGVEAGFIQRDYEGPCYPRAGGAFMLQVHASSKRHRNLAMRIHDACLCRNPHKSLIVVLISVLIFFYVVCLLICMRRKLAVFVILCPKIGSAGGAWWRSRSLVLLPITCDRTSDI